MLATFDHDDLSRVIEGKRATIATDFAAEAPLLTPLPSESFDADRHVTARVDAKSRICIRQCRYSVPVAFVGRRIEVAIGATEIVASVKGKVVASHERLVERGDQSLHLAHYSEVLVRKPGALASSAPLDRARTEGTFTPTHDAYWEEAVVSWGTAKVLALWWTSYCSLGVSPPVR